jgi:uncharacterized protein (TIGR02996 family)
VPSVLAIVSKAVFERDGAGAKPGDTLPLDRYLSANKGLAPLAGGGSLFMVTVRPPDERLWLVGVLRDPSFVDDHWEAATNSAPIADITELLPRIQLANGKGIKPKPGRLGMSLQTPRVLSEADVALLLGACAPDTSTASEPAPPVVAGSPMLADVIAAPDDDAPRLVMADWLMERGDPRGEFIAAQVRLASRAIFRSQRLDLRARASELLQRHRRQWTDFGPAGKGAQWRFRRGFVVEVEAGAKELLEVAARLFAREPVLRLKLHSCDLAALEALGRAPWLERLEALKLHGELGDEGAALLADLDGLRNLRLLNLYDCGLGAAGAEAIAGSRALGALRTLTLTANEIGDGGAAALARSANLQACEKLYLARTEIGDPGVSELARSPHLRHLRELGLGGNWDISDASAEALGASPNLPRLGWLELESTDVSYDAADALRARFPRLRS